MHRPLAVSQLLNKPYDAFADEGADEDTQLDAKAVKKQRQSSSPPDTPTPVTRDLSVD